MSNFFKRFPSSTYEFSDVTGQKTQITDIFRYVSSEDKKLDGIVNYTYYNVPEGMRPDNLSFKLYGTPDYYWTFFIINTALKQGGLNSWPKGSSELENFIFEKYMKYAVIEMNSIEEQFSYKIIDPITFVEDTKNTSIFKKSVKGIALDSDIYFVSTDKTCECSFISYKDDQIVLNKNTISSLQFSPNDEIYWNLPKIKIVSDVGYNGEVSFQFRYITEGSILSDEILISNPGKNYFTSPSVEVDESPERECLFHIDLTNGSVVIDYPGKNYCRIPKLRIKIPSIQYDSGFLNAFQIDLTKQYGLKTSYFVSSTILDLLNDNPNNYVAQLTNDDNPLLIPSVIVSNSETINKSLSSFTLLNKNLDVLKRLQWNMELFTWVLNNRIDLIVVDTDSAKALANFKLTQELSQYIYRILTQIVTAIKNGATLNSIVSEILTSTVSEMVNYFDNTIYSFLTKHIKNVIIASNIDLPFDYTDRFFYEGFNYKNKIDGSFFGVSDGWIIPEYSYGRNGKAYKAPTFSLENLYVYNLPSGIGSMVFGEQTIAKQVNIWNSEFEYFDLNEKWYSFKVKKIGTNPFGNFCIFSEISLDNVRDGGIGIQIAGNTVYDVIQNGSPSEAYIHDFETDDSVTIVGRSQVNPFSSSVVNTLWFNPSESFITQSEIEASDLRRSINEYNFSGNLNDILEQKLSGIGFENNTGFVIDEVRIGKTFESVTQTPPLSIENLKKYLEDITDKSIIEPTVNKLVFSTQGIYGEAQNATHHYEDLEGNQLSYYTGVNSLNGPGNARITNYEYEVALNDQVKEIKIVRPEYIKQFDTVYKNLINS